jgi:hypothetical protein
MERLPEVSSAAGGKRIEVKDDVLLVENVIVFSLGRGNILNNGSE